MSVEGGVLLTGGLCRDLELDPVPEFDALFGIGPGSEEAWGHHREIIRAPREFARLGAIPGYHGEKGWLGLDPAVETLAEAKPGIGGGIGAETTRTLAVSSLFRRQYPCGGQAVFYGGDIVFRADAQAVFRDAAVFPALLEDVCELGGAVPLGTRDDELARARVDGNVLILREDSICAVTGD